MTTNFPTSLDVLPTAVDLSDDSLATKPHSTVHGDANDAIEALQAKVGIDGSAVTTSLDYIVSNIGAWESWTPFLGSSGVAPNLGSTGVSIGHVARIGQTAVIQFYFGFSGTGVSAGTGIYRVIQSGGGLPYPAAPIFEDAGSSSYPIGSGAANDASHGLDTFSHAQLTWAIDNTATALDPALQYMLAALDVRAGNKTAQGTATVLSGTSYIDVTHGLGVTPVLSDIVLTLGSNLNSSGMASWWVDTITSTQFRINGVTSGGANLTGNQTFGWRANAAQTYGYLSATDPWIPAASDQIWGLGVYRIRDGY